MTDRHIRLVPSRERRLAATSKGPRTRYILPNDVVSHNTQHRRFVTNFRGRPQRRIPMENFCSRNETIRSLELSFLGPFVAGNFRSRGTKVPGNFRSLDLSFRETFVSRTFEPLYSPRQVAQCKEISFPPTTLQSISYEPQTAVTTVRIFRRRPSTVRFPKIN